MTGTAPPTISAPDWQPEVIAANIRWAELKQYLRDRITAETPVMEGFRGEITGAASGGIVSACRFALAEMKRLEGE